jgi:metallophosphoesterase (TIGR00282 family)
MKILFIGDIVGKPGRRAVAGILPKLKKELKIDAVIANVENLAHGKGLNESSLQEMIDAGVDIATGGDHIFDKPAAEELFKSEPNILVRPLNFPEIKVGQGSKTFHLGQKTVTVVNLLGQFGMANPPSESPFEAMQRWMKKMPVSDITILDLHAEATSEKVNMGWWLDGKVTAILGTHTHVRTADERVLPNGTGYISDVGMTGLRDSSLGIDKDITVQRFLTGAHIVHEIPDHGVAMLNAVLLEEKDGRCVSIERVYREINL